MFCAACGRNLTAVEQLPTRAEWEAGAAQPTAAPPADTQAAPPAGTRPLADRCAEATAEFLEAMHAAGDPGTTKLPLTGRTGFLKTPSLRGWIVRPVARNEDTVEIKELKRYDPGLLLTVDGAFHRIDSEVRGWGQRDFPQFHDSADPDPVAMPVEERLIDELAAVRRNSATG